MGKTSLLWNLICSLLGSLYWTLFLSFSILSCATSNVYHSLLLFGLTWFPRSIFMMHIYSFTYSSDANSGWSYWTGYRIEDSNHLVSIISKRVKKTASHSFCEEGRNHLSPLSNNGYHVFGRSPLWSIWSLWVKYDVLSMVGITTFLRFW